MKDITHLIMWLFIGALCVLVLTHAAGFATATTAVGGQLTNDAYLLTGANQPAGGKAGTAPASWG